MKSTNIIAGLAFCLLFFTNCNQKPADGNGADGQAAVGIPANIGGYWVNKAWWQELQRTKSPKMAAAKLDYLAAAILHQDKDKWIADMSYNWHEGQQLTLREKDGGLQLYDPQNANVHAYALVPQQDSSIVFDSTGMVRLGDSFTGFNAIAHAVVGGQYDWNGKTVVFNPNGTLVGLEDYFHYKVGKVKYELVKK